ncbi:hypothetical protein [Staphylospora marina]|uniref:hypothetical protein n=1 Tax=Staphylospora marina TaxID=2490858 RepID=UPI000F5BFED9|nr:hypothetical protein [Staphylospora marina]
MTGNVFVHKWFTQSVVKLPPKIQVQAWNMVHQFMEHPGAPGLNFEKLHGDRNLYSLRVNDQYRAILFKPEK